MNTKGYTKFCFLFAILLISASTSSTATEPVQTNTTKVYKVTHEDGSVSYSDKAQTNAEEIDVKPVSTIPAVDITRNRHLTPERKKNGLVSYYQSLEIIKPAQGSAFHSGSGNISASVKVIPKLKNGDQLQFVVDGQLLSSQTSSQVTLNHMDRGSHTIKVNVVSAAGKVIKSTSSTFTVHRPIARP